MSYKKFYNLTINVAVKVERPDNDRRIPWVSFKGWKNGIFTKSNRIIYTEPIVKATNENMKYIGKCIFDAAKEMYYEDEPPENE